MSLVDIWGEKKRPWYIKGKRPPYLYGGTVGQNWRPDSVTLYWDWYRPPDWGKVGKAFFKQLEVVSESQTLVFMGVDLNFSGICWEDNMVGYKWSQKCMEGVRDDALI